ncbi:uncharacterized protein LOC144162426 [Haemaphysalis longicornis]
MPTSETQHSTPASYHWSSDNQLPEFSSFVEPLLNGMEVTEKENRQQMRQLRHEIIHFLDRNKLIQDSNNAMRRWKYFALGESLASAFPNMLWEKPLKNKDGRTKTPKSVFLTRLAEARRHRLHRKTREWKKKQETSTVAVSFAPETIHCEPALQELSGRWDL